MGEPSGIFPLKSHRPLIQLIVILLVILVVSTGLILITMLASRLIYGPGMAGIDLSASSILPSQRVYLVVVQSMSQLSVFLVPGILISWMMAGNITGWLGLKRSPSMLSILMVFVIAISLIPLTSITGAYNAEMDLPQWLDRLEIWMRKEEENAMYLTGHLVYAGSAAGMIINIFTLAVIPAAGEEILFRGVFQQLLKKWSGSGIAAVIITAILFSTLHLQFYGFVPRFILGVAFGLLFLWSGSVYLPFIAHLVNNMIPVILSYYVGWDNLNSGITENVPVDPAVIILAIIVPAALLYLFRDIQKSR
ncbi:MAG: CPBP family intramembrane glutamic endopeptidase [Bacteroidales bacterium]